MATVTPYRGPVHAVAALTTADVVGGRFVKISADRSSGPGLATTGEGSNLKVAHATAGSAARGVAAFDVTSRTKILTVFDSGTVPVEAGADIAAGAKVMASTAGVAITWTTAASEANECLGVCETAVTSGNLAQIKLNLG